MVFSLLFIKAVMILALVIHMNNGTLSFSSSSSDHNALLEIKSKITNDPHGVVSSWNDSFPFCQWKGVTCARHHKRVTMLNLRSRDLVGTLSPYLGNLSFLGYVLLDNNKLHGSIPLEMGRLYRLRVLSLYNNSITGEIPSNMSSWPKLSVLNLGTNKLSGKIPLTFSSLLMINVLALGKNGLTGGIPSSMGNLTSLIILSLSFNPLSGSIPDSFSQLKNLQKIGLATTNLSGAFPLSFFNLSMLYILSVTQNQLHGSLPSNLCLNQPHIRLLELAGNHFSGFLPPSISNCSEMEIIDVGYNNFTGNLAIDFGKLQHLHAVVLSANSFETKGHDAMKFVDSLSNCSNLEALEIAFIPFRGVLPNSLGNFSSKLQYLALHLNFISGGLPSFIGNLVGLTTLDLSSNNFTGMIPESIGRLQNLERLDLESNAFSGIIPRSFGNLTSVIKATLSENKLEGTIPSTIGSCKKLIYLDLHENNLRGSIPKELFQLSTLSILLDLSQNNLSGVLPQEIGSLRNLGQVDLSQNHFSGELPSSLGSCISLEILNLSHNLFHGSMPEALRSLKGLVSVDLSRNNFSGQIPAYLHQIALKHLDLSYNNFEGEVSAKGVFTNASAISIIENHRLCGGILELNLTKCKTTNSDSKRGRKLSIGVVVAISLSSTVTGLALVAFLLFYCCIKKKKENPSEPLSIESFEKIAYKSLFKATEGFSSGNLIGTGSFASVYKGVLDGNGFTVAIKVLNLQRQGGFKSFIAECDALRNLRHRNLVRVMTCCSSVDFQGNDFKALVYDFMPNGSLETWLHSTHRKLDLLQRINIIKDVACALEYLHCHCGNVVVHCDLKPSNILLDAGMVAHVGDFGLAKILSLEDVSDTNMRSSSTLIRGTIGYAPPEYGLGNEVSTRGDIYSYGILLLEMLTGRKPVDPMFEQGLSLHSYARASLTDGFVLQIMDQMLMHKQDVNEDSLISLLKIGVQCSAESPEDRMDIETAVHELLPINISYN